MAEPKPRPRGLEALLSQGSLITPSPSKGGGRAGGEGFRDRGLLPVLSALRVCRLFRAGNSSLSQSSSFPLSLHPEPLPSPVPLEGPGKSIRLSVNLRGSDQQLEMDGQEAVTMDERPSVPRWVGEGEAGNRSLPPRRPGAGWQAGGQGCQNLQGLFGFPKDPSREPFTNLGQAHLHGVPGPRCV